MRCDQCNLMVAYDTEVDPEELGDLSFEGDAFTLEVRRVLTCEQCGQELKDAELTLEGEVQLSESLETDEGKTLCTEDHEWEDVEHSVTPTDRSQTHDRHGKPIKSMRYARRYYGAELSGTVRCTVCGVEGTIEATAEEQASGFNELI